MGSARFSWRRVAVMRSVRFVAERACAFVLSSQASRTRDGTSKVGRASKISHSITEWRTRNGGSLNFGLETALRLARDRGWKNGLPESHGAIENARS